MKGVNILNIPKYKLQDQEEYRICKLEEKLTDDFLSSHQHQYFEIIFFTEVLDENMQHSIDFRAHQILENRLFFIASNQVHQWLLEHYDEEFKGYFIVFNESYIKADNALLDLFDFLNNEPFLDLSEDEIEIPLKLIGLIEEDAESNNGAYKKSLIEALLHFFSKKKHKFQKNMSINEKRFMELRTLIEQNYKNEKQVSFYAHKMDMLGKRLNEVVKSVSSLTISELVQKRVLLEAKRELSLGSKTVQKISEELGYHDPSYFSKFFKKHEGISPSVYMGK